MCNLEDKTLQSGKIYSCGVDDQLSIQFLRRFLMFIGTFFFLTMVLKAEGENAVSKCEQQSKKDH